MPTGKCEMVWSIVTCVPLFMPVAEAAWLKPRRSLALFHIIFSLATVAWTSLCSVTTNISKCSWIVHQYIAYPIWKVVTKYIEWCIRNNHIKYNLKWQPIDNNINFRLGEWLRLFWYIFCNTVAHIWENAWDQMILTWFQVCGDCNCYIAILSYTHLSSATPFNRNYTGIPFCKGQRN